MNKNTLKWNFIFQYGYVITNIINSIILLPFYLHKIDASTLGVWLATGNILAWMTLIDPGVGDVLQQKVAELRGRNENGEIGKTIGSGLMAAGGILLLAVIAGFVFYFLIGAIIDKDVTKYPNLQIALFLSIIATGMSLVSFSMSGINQGLHNASPVAISSITANILFLIVNILLLLFGFGVISIAFANLCRAVYINIYNFSALKILLNKEKISIIFKFEHFKKFIKIFSFTSLASIIGGFSASMDTIVLARYIAPFMITIFEINKRPVQLTQSMVGRHSVALMPIISHAAGKGDKPGIMDLIHKQFKYYSYAAIFIGIIFCYEYRDLINAWTGQNKFAGNTILYLLVANFFFGLIGYFMQNMGYALGDIKMNSLVSICKGLGIGGLYYVFGKNYGIVGILSVMLFGNLVVEFSYFTHRLFKLGFLDSAYIKSTLLNWLIIIPSVAAICWFTCYGINAVIASNLYVLKIALNSGIIFSVFVGVVLLIDGTFRNDIVGHGKKLLRSKRLDQKDYPTNSEVISMQIPMMDNNLIKQ
jgi:O-antigen/teichoic acid export membrane protein